MSNLPSYLAIESLQAWEIAWNAKDGKRRTQSEVTFREIAAYVAGSISSSGFRLFQNGGAPLLERRMGPIREEILFVPAPRMLYRSELPFTIHLHLSSSEVAKVRSRFWRPACRAPQIVASGNIGQVQLPPCYYIFYGSHHLSCADHVVRLIEDEALPWFHIFKSPLRMKKNLYRRSVPLVDDSTALELLLSEFDPFEARRFVNQPGIKNRILPGPVQEAEGYDLMSDRLAPIRAYYKL